MHFIFESSVAQNNMKVYEISPKHQETAEECLAWCGQML